MDATIAREIAAGNALVVLPVSVVLESEVCSRGCNERRARAPRGHRSARVVTHCGARGIA